LLLQLAISLSCSKQSAGTSAKDVGMDSSITCWFHKAAAGRERERILVTLGGTLSSGVYRNPSQGCFSWIKRKKVVAKLPGYFLWFQRDDVQQPLALQ
jgi:hypothetical protein